jgi:peptidyl-prolyl cis-trans isomerase D
MFDLVQKYKRAIQVFLFLIALTFMTWGIESYTRFQGSGDAVATVNGAEITRREFDDEMRRQQDQLRQMFGGQFNPEVFDTPEARSALVDGLVSQRLVAEAAIRARLTVSDETLREMIAQAPEFQVDGQFSKTAYETMLRSQNPPLTPMQYEARLRHSLAVQQLAFAVGAAAIPSRSVTERIASIEAQKREVSEARLAPQQYLAQVKIDDAKLKEYYDANAAEFRLPERVRAEYVVLSAEQLARNEPVSEAELKEAYQNRLAQMTESEQRRASHILVKTREEAQKIALDLQKNPNRFADLAKKESQDPGSAEKGGDLGWFGRGMMVKPFEDAAFGMKQGETSGPVQSDFGFHIIRVTGTKAAKARPFEDARAEIEADLKKSRAGRRYSEAAETFTNMVYEQAESLKPVAERFKLQVQTTGWIAKSSAQELGALDNPKLVAALFSPDAIQNKRNTDAIEVAPATLVSARVLEHQPPSQRKFEEVKQELAEMLRRREASTLAQKDGMAKLEQLRKGEAAGLTWSAPRTVSRRDSKGLAPDLLRQAVAADVSKLPAFVGVPTQEGGYALLRISKVTEAGPAEMAADAAQRAAAMLGQAQYQAYVASLRSQADIEVKNLTPAAEKK